MSLLSLQKSCFACQGLRVLLMHLVFVVCSTNLAQAEQAAENTTAIEAGSERLLLDVGVGIFSPGLDKSATGTSKLFPNIRRAEARYLPYRLMDVLQDSAQWGSVRVVPEAYDAMDVRVDGEILHSDGNILTLRISVQDSSGRVWYRKRYAEDYDHNPDTGPFKLLYDRISEDLSTQGKRLSATDRTGLKDITTLRFAQRMAPGIFAGYLSRNSHGRYHIKRLPANDSPDIQRISRTRIRYDMFIDTLQLHYGLFAARMEIPYLAWLAESVREQANLQQLHQQSRHNIVHGIVTVFASLNPFSRYRRNKDRYGPVGIAKGKDEIRNGFAARQEAKIHRVALQELGESFNAVMQPQIMNIDARTVTLTGTVSEQLEQWRKILYEIDIGEQYSY